MPGAGESEPRKGSGYFAKRLKEKGISAESEKKDAEEGVKEPESKAGQIFEESTKSIATMADDVSETAKLVSSMKEGLERVTKIAGMFSDNPLCDSTGSCNFGGVNFSQDQGQDKMSSVEELPHEAPEWPVLDMGNEMSEYSDSNFERTSDIQHDANAMTGTEDLSGVTGVEDLELLEFREKLRRVGHRTGLASQMLADAGSDYTVGDLGGVQNTEFDTITSSGNANFESVLGSFDKNETEAQIKEGEKRLVELRWKIKKADMEYEKRRAMAEELDDLTAQVEKLESKKSQLEGEIRELEEKHSEPKAALKEIRQKIEIAERELEEKQAAGKQLDDVRSILEYLKLDKDGLKSEIESLRARIKEAEKELEEKRSAADSLEDVRFTVISMRAEKETLDTELDRLRATVKKAEMECEERRLESEKIGETRSALAHLRLEKDSLETELFDLKSKIKKAESEYRQKKEAAEEIQEVREVLAYLKPEREYLRQELQHIRSRMGGLEQSCDDLSSKKRRVQEEYDDLVLKVKRLEGEYEEKRSLSRLS